MFAALGQKQIAGSERIPDREGESNLPDVTVDLAVLDEIETPGGRNETLRIIRLDRFARAGVEFP